METVFDHHDSLEPQQAFIAFFDVLGFQSRLRQYSLKELIAGYRRLAETKMQSGTIPILSKQGGAYRQVGSTIFSDSILFWCNDDWDAVQSLVTASAYLIAAAIDIDWPLRGGLAYGECVLDRETRTFVGQPIIDAYNTEQSQEWIGAGLHRSVIEHPSLGTRICRLEDVVDHDVPTKCCQPALRHAIHWCPYSSRARDAIEGMSRSVDDPRTRRYYDLALAYVMGRCEGSHASAL
jgi:hypothetical protein